MAEKKNGNNIHAHNHLQHKPYNRKNPTNKKKNARDDSEMLEHAEPFAQCINSIHKF